MKRKEVAVVGVTMAGMVFFFFDQLSVGNVVGNMLEDRDIWADYQVYKLLKRSIGAGNDYGHPHKETLKKYQALKMKVYETDKNGTITLISDGKSYEVKVEKGEVQ